MKFFLDYIRENRKLSNFLEVVAEIKGHQGSVIRFSESFLSLYSVFKKKEKNIYIIFTSYARFSELGYLPNFPLITSMPYLEESIFTDTSKINFEEIENFKEIIPEGLNKANFNAIEVVISVFNDADIGLFEKTIIEYRDDQNYKVIIEKRGRNIFLNSKRKHDLLVGGISISDDDENTFGTLGGFLKNETSDIFGLTCSHIFSGNNKNIFQPAKYDASENDRIIGSLYYHSTLKFSDFRSSCTHKDPGNLDIALISLYEKVRCRSTIEGLGNVTSVMSFDDIHQGMKIEFNGRSTNQRKQLIIGGLCVSYKIAYEHDSETKYACFTNLIELRDVPTKFLCTGYHFQKSPVQPGDSGAWICSNNTNGYSWCGMLISGDIDRGYFMSSEHILEQINKKGFLLNI